jgi:hypothetical protein
MSDIKAILLVPSEGDPHGLLREGPCGARPPMAVEGSESWSACPWYPECGAIRASLVLAWDGKAVMEGCFRAEMTLTALDSGEIPSWQLLAKIVQEYVDYGKWRARLRRILGNGTIVLLDSSRKEIK